MTIAGVDKVHGVDSGKDGSGGFVADITCLRGAYRLRMTKDLVGYAKI